MLLIPRTANVGVVRLYLLIINIIESMSRAKEEEKGTRYAQKEDETWKIKDIVGEFKESTSRHFRFLLFVELER